MNETRTPIEVTTRYATTVTDLTAAWTFVMDRIDTVGPHPSITISPVWTISVQRHGRRRAGWWIPTALFGRGRGHGRGDAMNVWLCAWPDGKSAHDTEVASKLAAREVVASGRATRCVVYPVTIEGEVA